MSGIYLHIPFCRKACHYCDFHFSTSFKTMPRVLAGMHHELRQRAADWPHTIHTIYFGGGTPSVLDTGDLKQLLELISDLYIVDPEAEITIEANPEDVHPGLLRSWRDAGINRLSMGVQSFFEDELQWMNRNHNAERSTTAVREAFDVGFDNITIDLIYGLPVSNDDRWAENVARAIDLNVPHLSAYALTVEPRTTLASRISRGIEPRPDEETAARQFHHLRSEMARAGFEHYEISNFARSGMQSRHNRNYWLGVPYLGIGPAAHSYTGETRRWNMAHNIKYAAALENQEPWYETETLSPIDRYNEFVMIGMRMLRGVSRDEVAQRFGDDCLRHFLGEAKFAEEMGLTRWSEGRLQLTEQGLFFADGVAAGLFLIKNNR